MRKIKVLHILNSNSYSGAENVVITIINTMKDKVEGIYLSREGSIRDILNENNIEFYGVNKLSVKELRMVIKEVKPDIIHAHDFTAGIISALSVVGIPIINHLHNNSPWIKTVSVKSMVYGLSCIRYKSILTVSESVMNEFIFGKYFKNKSRVIGNPVNVKKVCDMAENADIADVVDIVFLGRLTLQKNPVFFLEMLRELKNKLPNIRVAMVGDGELRGQVEEKIKELDLEENVILYGFQKNPFGILKAGKVLCIPSLWEGFGLVAVEALSLGKPVVAANVGGLKDIINESCGKLCVDAADYINELGLLLKDEKIYKEKSRQALIRAGELDNIFEYINEIYKVYNQDFNVK